ncbi:MAG: sugar phosphate nucleotidyltransferase [Anaerolineaceae bacterium]|nr:sugar phosphate nucleotidyltransferase [Anaerolineaceae bacterium]
MTTPLKIVIPMAGLGSRLRPHTWSKPKPLVPLAGGTVLDHLMNMFKTVTDVDKAEFIFILSPNQGDQIQEFVSKNYPQKKVRFVIQPEMKGQSDALWQARAHLKGRTIMVFSDTLIENTYEFLDTEGSDAIAWVKAVPDPRRFGVAEVNSSGFVTRLIEKPRDMDNNLAVVGFYYFREGEALVAAIEEQIERNVSLKGEFFLTDAINILIEKGIKMRIENVTHWLDAGTPEALMDTNRFLLENGRASTDLTRDFEDTVIIPPVNIHSEARISGSIIGPYVSIGAGSVIQGSILRDTIVGLSAHITGSQLESSLLGNQVVVNGQIGKFNLGDHSWAVK